MAILNRMIDPRDVSPRNTGQAGRRIVWIDGARGAAILGVVAYHGAFDLAFLGLTDWPVTVHPAWRALAAGLASTFLFLTGVSLVIAHRDGVQWRAFVRRLLVISGAAAAVTIATAIAMPVAIWFGILHAIALFSVLALPFVFAPPAITALVAAAVFALPFAWRHPIFFEPWAYPLGLAPIGPYAFDYEPVFPWASVTLAGVAAARLLRPHARGSETADPGAAWRGLARIGRHTLAIYCLHQPVLLGLLLAGLWLSRQ